MRKKGNIIFLLVTLCLAGKTQVPLAEQFHLDLDELRFHLAKAPQLTSATTVDTPVKILLPTPEGAQDTFEVWEDPILAADLQTKFSEYSTYSLQAKHQPYIGRLMMSPAGLDAVIISGDQVLFIESVAATPTLHRVYYWKLGSSYLSFDLPDDQLIQSDIQALKLAIVADEEYTQFHQEELTRSVFASINGVNAFLEMSQGIHLDLHYFSTVDHEQIDICKTEGFQGRSGESIKVFGDLIEQGKLQLNDFDLGHLFSGRGFGGSALAGVAGKNTYYDWNEDDKFDGPAKAGGGSGAARPTGANWWGNLCKGISRQIKASDLALSVQRSTDYLVESDNQLSADLGNLEHFPVTMKHYSGPRAMGEIDFPHLSCLPFNLENTLSAEPLPFAGWQMKAFPTFQTSFVGGALWPMLINRSETRSIRTWLQAWRF